MLRYQPVFRNLLLVVVMLTAALTAYFLSISVIAFQKAAIIVPVDKLQAFPNSADTRLQSAFPDVRQLLGAIPYQSGKAIYDILPRDRYDKTIKNGYGNCSNLSFGMAVYLLRHNYDFRIVHILPYDDFLTGNGHTLLEMPYLLDGASRIGLVDIMEGGLPQVVDDVFIDFSMLQQKHLNAPSILPLNSRKDGGSPYYEGFLNNSAVGIAPGEEIARYFDFIDKLYIDLGNKRLERIIFSGIAIVADYYPHTYVAREDYARLFAGKMQVVWAARTLVWLFRLIPLLGFMLVVLSILGKRFAVEERRPATFDGQSKTV